MDKKSILVFGLGELQRSIIRKARRKGLFTIGIDPCADAVSKDEVDVFEVVGGQDFEKTMEVARKYGVSAIVTAAADKPLVMMARVAREMGFPFFSVETAQWTTDKYQMKQRFMENGIPCARGRLIAKAEEAKGLSYPLMVKPRDNSGSRGVKRCASEEELQASVQEALAYSKLDTVLVEECIEGQEYSIEGLHYDGKSEVIQFTEKLTTAYPYSVELAHKQPANLTEGQQERIRALVARLADCLHFECCASHTELKINEKGIFIIETSPRLGGDYITSDLVPLSTGIDMEEQLLHIVLGEKVDTRTGRADKASGVRFFSLPEGKVTQIAPDIRTLVSRPGVHAFSLKLKEGNMVHQITNSLNRYGEVIVSGENRCAVDKLLEECNQALEKGISIEGC
ncbi:MAG: ATP-grasp domain-containing protein [Bacteroidales bacterium]|nr:ATP-grasp domain-containing protein [Bacteroidales bacterium]